MTDYCSLSDIATAMGQSTESLVHSLSNLGLIGYGTRPSICALVTRVAKKFPYSDGDGRHDYRWSIERITALTRAET